MRLLFLPACLCLMTWSGATAPDAKPPFDNLANASAGKVLAMSADHRKPQHAPIELASLEPVPDRLEAAPRSTAPIDTSQAPANFERVALPLASLHRLMAPYEPIALPLKPLRAMLKPIIPRSRAEICDSLTQAARVNDLPTPFFIRLLYQESEFKQGVISSAGALGIAQFMQETATDRGLDNPFDPLQAIPASAKFLRDLAQRFGNLGLAAAAYNAGPRRIADWLANKAKLPQETHDYVKTITGRPAENWNGVQAGSPALKLPKRAPCQDAAGLLAWNGPDQIPMPLRDPRKPEPKKTKVAKKGKPDKAQAGKDAGKQETKTADDKKRDRDERTAKTDKKQPADKKAEKKRGDDERATKAEKHGDGHVAKADKKHAAPEHAAKTEKKHDADEHTAKAENKHKRDADKQVARHHEKRRKVEFTER
jgi:Transglycosylase SLT domain